MIKEVFFKNFKNKGENQKISGFDLFIGPNGSGKSSVLEAVELTTLGKIQGNLKPKNIFKNSSDGKSFSVGIQTDKFKIARTYQKKTVKDEEENVTATFSEKISVSGMGAAVANKKKEEFIKENIGNFPVGFDFNEFIGMNDNEKRNFILSFSKGSSYTEEMAKEYLVNGKTEEVDKDVLSDAVKYLFEKEDIADIQAKISSMLTEAKDQKSFFKKELDKQTKVIQNLSDKKTTFSVSEKGLEIDKKKVEKLSEKLISEEKAISVIEEENKKVSSTVTKLEKAQKELKEIEDSKQSENAEDVAKKILGKKAEIEKYDKCLLTISKELEKASSEYKKITEEVEIQRKKFNSVKDKGIESKTLFETENKLVKQVEGTKGKCAINSSLPCNADFSKWLVDKKAELEKMAKTLAELRTSYKKEDEALKLLEEKAKNISAERETLIARQQKGIQTKDATSKELTSLEKIAETIKNFDSVKNEKLKNKKEEIEKLKNEKKETVDTKIKKEEIEKIRTDLEVLKKEVSEKEKVKVLTTQIKESKKEYDDTNNKFIVYKYLVTKLGQKGLQGEIFKSLVSPIVELIDKNLSYLGEERKFFISTVDEQESEVFNFGLKGEKEIDFTTLSTGQKAIVSIAMIIAFIEKAEIPYKIFCLDNLETLDSDNINKVLKGLSVIYSEKLLDNILIAGCVKGIENIPENLKIWDMGEKIL